MLRTVFVSIWAIAATVGAVFFFLPSSGKEDKAQLPSILGPEEQKTPVIAIPIFSKKQVSGYFVAKVRYTFNGGLVDPAVTPVEPMIHHAFHKIIYKRPDDEFATPSEVDIEEIASEIMAAVNEQFGSPIIETAGLSDVDYLSREGK